MREGGREGGRERECEWESRRKSMNYYSEHCPSPPQSGSTESCSPGSSPENLRGEGMGVGDDEWWVVKGGEEKKSGEEMLAVNA